MRGAIRHRLPVIQPLIALDQLANTLAWARLEGLGFADETLSARAWRLRRARGLWRHAAPLIDALFFWEPAHCERAYRAEFARRQLPDHYQASAIQNPRVGT